MAGRHRLHPEIYDRVKAIAEPKLQSVVTIAEKQERNAAQDAALEATMAELALDEDDSEGRDRRRSVPSSRWSRTS